MAIINVGSEFKKNVKKKRNKIYFRRNIKHA